MYERMQYVVISAWEKSPDEKAILIFEDEKSAVGVVKRLNKTVSPYLGQPRYRVSLVRISEMPDTMPDDSPLTEDEKAVLRGDYNISDIDHDVSNYNDIPPLT
jgi:hypothetical protein